MDDPSLLPFLNNNDNGHHYSISMDDEIEHEEDELDDDENNHIEQDDEENVIEEEEEDIVQNYEQIQQYPEDEIDEDEIEEDDIDDDDEQEIVLNQPPPPPQQQQTERGGRRKGVPRRLQLSPQEIVKTPVPQQRLLPLSSTKSSSTVQPILTFDQEDINEISDDFNNENHYDEYDNDKQEQNSIQYDLLSKHFIDNDYDENNNNNNDDDNNNILEIVDDLLADVVNKIVQDIRQERQKNFKIPNGKMNGYSSHKLPTNSLSKSLNKREQKIPNGKHKMNDFIQTNSIKSSKSHSQQSSSSKLCDSSTLFNEFTKMMHLNSHQQLVKQKQSSLNSSPPSAKRQKTSESTSPSLSSLQQQHQQLLWQMTQQLMMSTQGSDTNDASSLLKQQLLGLVPPVPIPKRVGRPPKQQTQPQIMRSSTNMIPTSTSVNQSPYDRANFAPRRRGRPPKYVTERGAISGLSSSHDLDPSSYDQLFAAIENNVTGNPTRTSSAAFQSALASMLGHQASLSIPSSLSPTAPVVRNGTPASMVKQSAGHTRHSLPSTATKLSHVVSGTGNGLDMPVMATKKRGPGRPPKTQLLIDSHQVLQATKRMNSSLSNNTSNNNNNFPPTMVPSAPHYAAIVDMLQQQHSH